MRSDRYRRAALALLLALPAAGVLAGVEPGAARESLDQGTRIPLRASDFGGLPWHLHESGSRSFQLGAPASSAEPQGPVGVAPGIAAPLRPNRGLGAGLADAPGPGRLSTEAGPGINLNWFDLGPACDREPYAIVARLHEPGVRERVTQLLVELRARGSESIAVGLYHFRAPGPTENGVWSGGTILDSTGGDLHPRMRANLVDLLADIRAAGFSQLLFRFHPQGANDAARWSRFEDDLFEENWNLIVNVLPIVEASGLDWRVDLMVEGMPRARYSRVFGQLIMFPTEPANEPWSRYANRLWQNYVSLFDPARSVGFSSLSDADPDRLRARIEHSTYVYRMGGTGERIYPGAFAFDIYGRPGVDEGELYRQIVDRLRRIGLGDIPLIIAETYYNDREAMALLSAAVRETGKPPLYLLHWPVDRRFEDCSADVNVVEPVELEELLRFGF
jgi:hypothetical protein